MSQPCSPLLLTQDADRYDVELFQKIEALTGQKMEKFEAEQDAALVLLDGVNEAQRIATMQVQNLQQFVLDTQRRCIAPLHPTLPAETLCRTSEFAGICRMKEATFSAVLPF